MAREPERRDETLLRMDVCVGVVCCVLWCACCCVACGFTLLRYLIYIYIFAKTLRPHKSTRELRTSERPGPFFRKAGGTRETHHPFRPKTALSCVIEYQNTSPSRSRAISILNKITHLQKSLSSRTRPRRRSRNTSPAASTSSAPSSPSHGHPRVSNRRL